MYETIRWHTNMEIEKWSFPGKFVHKIVNNSLNFTATYRKGKRTGNEKRDDTSEELEADTFGGDHEHGYSHEYSPESAKRLSNN